LASQPVSLVGLSQSERDCIVVTAVADDAGAEHVVSRFGDAVWDLTPEVIAKNRVRSESQIKWPTDLVPADLINDAKAALYCALRRGRSDGYKWSGSYVAGAGRAGVVALVHLAKLGLQNFSEVRALHLSDYVVTLRQTLRPTTIRNRMDIVDLVWCFHHEVFHQLPQHPWGGKALPTLCGGVDESDDPAGRTGKTPVIPRSVQRLLFEHSERRLDVGEALLQARDEGRLVAWGHELTGLRDAVLYLLQVTSGMRNSEAVEVTNSCWRTKVKNGVSYHWVGTKEIKTGLGAVEFLVPPEAIRALELLQRYAAPLQARLIAEASWLEGLLARGGDAAGVLANGFSVAEAVQRLNHVREIATHMFLCVSHSKADHLGTGRVDVLSVRGSNAQLRTLARAAGTDWKLANHQCRRTFGYNVANSRLGRMGLVFLKWQLKHSSMSWTQLYASNPKQDSSLYREMEDELIQCRAELVEGWLRPDAPLAGGAGKKLMQTRATPVKDLKTLLLHTAESVDIRCTGHSWCLSGTRGCHGQGVYDPSMCTPCSQAIIDDQVAPAWQMIHLDNLALAALTDCGPAVIARADRIVKRSVEVLQDLGVPLPTRSQAEAYARGVPIA